MINFFDEFIVDRDAIIAVYCSETHFVVAWGNKDKPMYWTYPLKDLCARRRNNMPGLFQDIIKELN